MAQGTTKGVPIDTDPTLAADSDLLVPSQKAVKTYADTKVPQTRSLTINGTAYDLSADRSWTISASATSVNVVSTNTAAGSAASTDYVYLVSGTTTITLPTAVGNTNRYTVKRSGTGVVSIATTSSQTIDGSASPITINVQYVSIDLISNGTNWEII
jgi:hypothetical protein